MKLDERRFQQVLTNVLSNAIKFQEKGVIEVEVMVLLKFGADSRNWKVVEVNVIDHGIGMTMKQLQTIFTPFNESASRGQYGGNGVGLSICKAICNSLNGRIEATSMPGDGTTVTFSQECFTLSKQEKAKKAKPPSTALQPIYEELLENCEEIKE